MSIKVMSWVFENGPRDPSERLVLLALADYANDAGEWSPSMVGIAEKAGMTERGARGVVRRLEANGWIEVQVGGGRGGRSHYRIVLGNPARQTRNEKPGMRNPEHGDAKPGTKRPETRNQRSAEPSRTIIEPSEYRAREAKPRRKPEVPIPPDWVPSDRNISDAEARQFSAQEIRDEADRFRNYHLSKGSRFRDWDAAWRTWLGNARRFAPRGRAPGRGGGMVEAFASVAAARSGRA